MQTYRLGAPPVVSAFRVRLPQLQWLRRGLHTQFRHCRGNQSRCTKRSPPLQPPCSHGRFFIYLRAFFWERVYVSSGARNLQDAKVHKVYAEKLCNLVRLTQIVIYGIIGTGGECKMALTDKQRKWRNDWERANRCQLSCKVHKDYAAHAKQVVAENGDTVSGVLKRAMDAYLEEHGQPFVKPIT